MSDTVVEIANRARARAKRLPLPAGVKTGRILWPYAISIASFHVLALLALLPWFFSWSGVASAVLGVLRVRHARHQPLLSPAADPSRLRLPEAGWSIFSPCSASVAFRIRRRAGSRCIAGTTSIPTSSPIRTARWSASSGVMCGWMLVENDDLKRLGIYRTLCRKICCANRSTSGWSASYG